MLATASSLRATASPLPRPRLSTSTLAAAPHCCRRPPGGRCLALSVLARQLRGLASVSGRRQRAAPSEPRPLRQAPACCWRRCQADPLPRPRHLRPPVSSIAKSRCPLHPTARRRNPSSPPRCAPKVRAAIDEPLPSPCPTAS
ncbi:hypothetical protein VPH35_112222 [Triticum aestivum]